MTSGNRSDEPIAIDDDDARARLGGIADAFLGHDRPIHRRCEDSVVRAGVPAAPLARLRARRRCRCRSPRRAPLVAVGRRAEEHVLRRARRARRSSRRTSATSTPRPPTRAFRTDLALYLDDARRRAGRDRVRPAPRLPLDARGRTSRGCRSSRCSTTTRTPPRASPSTARPGAALARRARRHRATAPTGRSGAASCCAATSPSFERVAHLEPVPLPGGEAAIREPWRVAAAYLERGRPAGAVRALAARAREPAGERAALLRRWAACSTPSPRCSACASGELRGPGRDRARAARGRRRRPSRTPCRGGVIRGADLVAAAHDDLAAGRPRAEIAAAFHEGVARGVRRGVRARPAGRGPSSLSGGMLPEPAPARLARARGSRRRASASSPHRLVPPNDGGVSYGQAAVAAARLASCA